MRSRSAPPFLIACVLLAVSGCSRTSGPAAALPALSAQVAVATETEEPAGFAFAQDEGGRLAYERLAVSRAEALESVPFATAPRPWRSAKLEQLPSAALALIDVPAIAHVSALEHSKPARARPALDTPPLVMNDKTVLAALPAFQAAPKVRVEGPDPLKVPPLVTSSRPPETLSPAADPTEEASRQIALAALTVLRTQPAPFLRLTIPDPFEHLKAVRLRSTPTEPIEPASPVGRPPLPPFVLRK